MEKKNVVIYVAGQRFSISTSDSEEYVIGIGEKVDVMIKGIAKDNPRLNRDACAILAALDLCDDESKLRQMMEVLRSQVKDYLEANEKLREENESLKAQLKAIKETSADITEPEKEDADTETDTAKTASASVSPVLSKSEAVVSADSVRHTAFVGKEIRSGKKNKKNKKHNKYQSFEPIAPAPVSVAPVEASDSIETESDSPYHQFSIFDGLE